MGGLTGLTAHTSPVGGVVSEWYATLDPVPESQGARIDRATFEAEFSAWRLTGQDVVGGVQPGQPNGLPQGWVSRAAYRDYTPGGDLHLVKRTAGGVALVHYEHNASKTTVWQSAASLAALYRGLVRNASTVAGMPRLTAWVQDVLISLYDPSDPVEAAEQTLAALAGSIRVLPRATF